MMQGINNFDPFYDTQQSLETFGEERMSASHRASVGLPPELKNYVRKLLEETENRVEDIKTAISQVLIVDVVVQFLEEAEPTVPDALLRQKYSELAQVLRSELRLRTSNGFSIQHQDGVFCLNSNNSTFNYGRNAPRSVGVGDGSQETPEYGKLSGEDADRLFREVILYLVENSKSPEEDSPLHGYVRPGSLVVGQDVDTEEEKEKLEGNLSKNVKEIFPRGKYMDMAMEYCHRYGLEGRENAVTAKIGKTLDNLRNQIENPSRKSKKFITVYKEWFPHPNWDPADIKSNLGDQSEVSNETFLDAHPFKLDEDGLRVRYHIIRQTENEGSYRIAECEYACYSHEECQCPRGCVLVTVKKILPKLDAHIIDEIEFGPTPAQENLMTGEVEKHTNLFWPHELIIPIPETVREVRERMAIEQGQVDEFTNLEKRIKKSTESARDYLCARSKKIQDPSTTLSAAKTALSEIESKVEQQELMIERDQLVQTLEQFLENCSVEDLRRKATARLAEITSTTTYWHTLISDMSVHIANKEKAAALQREEIATKQLEMQGLGEKAERLQRTALKAIEEARALNNHFLGRNPIVAVLNKIEAAKNCRERINKQVEEIEKIFDKSNPVTRKAMAQGTQYLRECDSIIDNLSKKRKDIERNTEFRQSDGTNQPTVPDTLQSAIMNRHNKRARKPKPNTKYL